MITTIVKYKIKSYGTYFEKTNYFKDEDTARLFSERIANKYRCKVDVLDVDSLERLFTIEPEKVLDKRLRL